MASMFFFVWIIIVLTFFAIVLGSTKAAKSSDRKRRANVRRTISSDGHAVSRKNDLTCETKYGHDHGDAQPRYIVHEDPDEGYVILNGIKRRLEDCKNL